MDTKRGNWLNCLFSKKQGNNVLFTDLQFYDHPVTFNVFSFEVIQQFPAFSYHHYE